MKIDFVDIVGMIFKTTFIEHESPRMTVVRFTRYLKLICLWVRPFSQPKIEDPFVEVLFGLCVATGDYHSNCSHLTLTKTLFLYCPPFPYYW